MKTHAVKEPISDNTLYVEVEPQPFDWVKYMDLLGKTGCYFGVSTRVSFPEITRKGWYPDISIGDTVYQGEEWGDPVYDPILLPRLWKKVMELRSGYWNWYSKEPPETMPIELAHKTFKVVGVEVINTIPIKEKWFWSYKLEEMNSRFHHFGSGPLDFFDPDEKPQD